MEIFISVFVMKFMDCALSTMKTVFLCKNKFFISSVLNSLAAALFIFVANSMAMAPEDQKNWIALTVFLANLIGGYFPPKFLDRFEADKLFVYVITAENFDEGKNFADKLRELNIPVSTTVVYNQKNIKTLTCNAYCNTRKESKIVNNVIEEFSEIGKLKYHIVDAM